MTDEPVKPRRRVVPSLDAASDGGLDRQFSMNLARGLEVMRAFTAAAPVLTNRAISERTGLPKATVSRLTYTLSRMGFLRQDAHGAFRLAIAVLSLSHPLLASMTLRQAARPVLQGLAQRTRCTVNLALCERVHAVYVDSVRSDLDNPHLPDIGSTAPLLRSSIGRALILCHDEPERVKLLNRIKLDDPAHHEAGIGFLAADAALLRAQGHCRGRGSWLPDIDAIAAPVPLPVGSEKAAISCTRVLRSGDPVDLEAFCPLLVEAAADIAREYRERVLAGDVAQWSAPR